MSGKQSKFHLEGESAMIQLMVSLILITLVSAISMVLLVLLWGLISEEGIAGVWNILTGSETSQGAGYLSVLIIIQQLAVFVIPTIVTGYFMTGNSLSYFGLNKRPRQLSVVIVIVLALFLIPVATFTGFVNEMADLPQWLSGLEGWLLDKEMEARETVTVLLENKERWSNVANIVIIALLPAIGEELFFRGLFLRIIEKGTRSSSIAVVLSALIFTILHFQFYGLLPRFILGVVYGLLFVWSRSLWLPMIAHFVNNLAAVIASGFIPVYSELGSAGSNDVLSAIPMALASGLVCIFLLVILRRLIRDHHAEEQGLI